MGEPSHTAGAAAGAHEAALKVLKVLIADPAHSARLQIMRSEGARPAQPVHQARTRLHLRHTAFCAWADWKQGALYIDACALEQKLVRCCIKPIVQGPPLAVCLLREREREWKWTSPVSYRPACRPHCRVQALQISKPCGKTPDQSASASVDLHLVLVRHLVRCL